MSQFQNWIVCSPNTNLYKAERIHGQVLPGATFRLQTPLKTHTQSVISLHFNLHK